ncbi:MAG: VOC family protein [Fimbriimonas sp.]
MADTNALQEFTNAVGNNFPWHELNVPDVPAAVAFYTAALGFGTKQMDMGEMGSYSMLTRDGQGIAGMMDTNHLPHPVPPHWAVYLAVDDVDARLEKCTALGATIVVPAMDIPTVGRMSLIADPLGAHIWLFTPSM